MSKQKTEYIFCDYCGKTEMYYQHTIKKHYYCGRCKEVKKIKTIK